MKRKLLVWQMLFLLMAGLLTGCQKQETVESEAVVTESVEPGEEPSGKVELTLWGAEEDGSLLEEMVEGFKQEYSGQAEFDIKIEYHS